MKKNAISLLALLLGLVSCLFSQSNQLNPPAEGETIRCYTAEVDAALRAANPELGTLEDFELWLAPLVEQYKAEQTLLVKENIITTIPIVFHIIHDGGAVGTGDNLDASFVDAQVEQLNNDFRRTSGTTGFNSHDRGADTGIEFCAAQYDPDGDLMPEPGIERVARSARGWTAPPYGDDSVENIIKPATIWNPNNYLNVWVCNIRGGVLGYARTPRSSGLEGMNPIFLGTSVTDGVVIDFTTLGSSSLPNPGSSVYGEGRTLTHEVGHWLGLLHIWGEEGCGNDFCEDTPQSDGPNGGCPNITSCDDKRDMVENYMDYTNDACMNIFTIDQKARMQAVLQNSPRRNFSASPACPGIWDSECRKSVTSFPYFEGFENGRGAWFQPSSDDIDWIPDSGGTPSSGTGPSRGGNGSVSYMYVESSSPNYPGKIAMLEGPCFDLRDATNATFSFDYHMYGADMGTLALQTRPNGSSTWTTQWQRSGDQGNAWKTAIISLYYFKGSSVQVRFRGTTGSSYRGDMAIDNIRVVEETCSNGISSFPYSNNFEVGFGAWSQAGPDDFNWTRKSGSTPSNNTGPSTASNGSWYLYCEASAPNKPRKNAYLLSNCFDFTNELTVRMSFDYHMYGNSGMGSLSLMASDDNMGTWTEVWSQAGNQGDLWKEVNLNLDEYAGKTVRFWFKGTTGETYASDIAIDNFSIANVSSCKNVTVEIRTNNYPAETRWEIRNNQNTLVASGGYYNQANTTFTSTKCLDLSNCNYTFTIFDSNGDGLCCGPGFGYYTVTAGSITYATGGNFGASESTSFCPTSSRSAPIIENDPLFPSTEALSDLMVFPNPTSNELNIKFKGYDQENATLRIMDLMGRAVRSEPLILFKDGMQESKMNVQNLPTGTYILQVELGYKRLNKRFVVVK